MVTSCIYCERWPKAESISNNRTETTKQCGERRITPSTPSCQQFSPSTHFYCERYNERVQLLGCLLRRWNPKKFESWEPCLKCRQFERIIKKLIEDFCILPTPDKKPIRELKRRKKQANLKPRREEEASSPLKNTRILKRRRR